MFETSRVFIIDQTKNIAKTPTEPAGWMARAIQLRRMCYMDLAVGDIWKAILLLDRQLDTIEKVHAHIGDAKSEEKLSTTMERLYGAYGLLFHWLEAMCDFHGMIKLCDEGFKKYETVFDLLFSEARDKARQLLAERSRDDRVWSSNTDVGKAAYMRLHGEGEWELLAQSGLNRPSAYPFTPSKYLSRQNDIIENAKRLFRIASTNCQLANSPIHGDRCPDVLGVFATRDIAISEKLLEDNTDIAACDVGAVPPAWNLAGIGLTMKMRMMVCDNCYGVSIPV